MQAEPEGRLEVEAENRVEPGGAGSSRVEPGGVLKVDNL